VSLEGVEEGVARVPVRRWWANQGLGMEIDPGADGFGGIQGLRLLGSRIQGVDSGASAPSVRPKVRLGAFVMVEEKFSPGGVG
jgi:hypothetical protein